MSLLGCCLHKQYLNPIPSHPWSNIEEEFTLCTGLTIPKLASTLPALFVIQIQFDGQEATLRVGIRLSRPPASMMLFLDLLGDHCLSGLEEERYSGVEVLGYPSWIRDNGGVVGVTATLLAAIDPRALALCNRKLSPRLWVLYFLRDAWLG